MEYRTIVNSDLQVSVITFGAWAIGGWMWGGTDVQAAREAIRAAYDHGVTSFDTAPAYGQGLSEEILGAALEGMPRDKVQILTKYGLRWDTQKGTFYFTTQDAKGNEIQMYKYAGKDGVFKECEESLRRLRTDYIDLYQIHWHDPSTPVEETMEAVLRLQEQGKIRYAGVCNYSVELMEQAEKVIPILSNQVLYNALQRDIEKDLVPYCLQKQKGILAYSPLARGLLTGKIVPGQQFARGDHRATHKLFRPEYVRRVNAFLNELNSLTEKYQCTVGQLMLRWTADQPGITTALAGARTVTQAIENAKAAELQLTEEERSFIRAGAEKLIFE